MFLQGIGILCDSTAENDYIFVVVKHPPFLHEVIDGNKGKPMLYIVI